MIHHIIEEAERDEILRGSQGTHIDPGLHPGTFVTGGSILKFKFLRDVLPVGWRADPSI